MKFAQVAVPLPVQDPFSYEMNGQAPAAKIGSRVVVPFKNREIQGYIVGFQSETEFKTKPISSLIDEEPLLDPNFLALTKWMSEYYYCSWGEAIENALPKSMKLGRAVNPDEAPAQEPVAFKPVEFELTAEQEDAVARIREASSSNEFHEFLLYGVTGSGKSEVYIRAIKSVLAEGKSAICLVPEIALTAQLRDFFRGHFPDTLEIIHSRLTDKERNLAWLRIYSGRSRVILGPRSALFAPVKRLGLVIIDEEHENSYKQAESPRYHAREVARKRAELESAVLILGSATPSLETMLRAEQGQVEKITLSKRVVDRTMPAVRIVDLRMELANHRKIPMFSQPLQREIMSALERKEGVLILLNRRGFATQVQCLKCGLIVQCRHCQISLTYHQSKKVLLCHYCNFECGLPQTCPECKSPELKYVGWGTEKIESEIAGYFPTARIGRLDTDVARKKGMHEKVIADFRARNIDILVGTQMIAKGFDFPQVTLVGVISADIGLALPDFRSSERTFQLLTQVAGRAGRGDLKGNVVIQTFSPNHHSIAHAKNHDYNSFYASEIKKRQEMNLPPFHRLVNIILQGKSEQDVYLHAMELKKSLKEEQMPHEIIGPAPLPFYRLRGHFRWHIMLKGDDVIEMNRRLRNSITRMKRIQRVKILVDVDPVAVL